MKDKTESRKKWDYIAAVVLLLYPLRHMTIGIDLMDAGYTLGNYRFFDTMNQTWKLATYLANVIGVLLSKLPFGDSWAGMNGYTGVLVGVVAATTYLLMVRWYGKRMIMFIAQFVAVSLCWAPAPVLYQYLGYLFMTIAVLILERAIITGVSKNYMIAGVIVGLCMIVRMPNITYMALILPVWYYCFLKKEPMLILLKRTGLCIAGYCIGIIVPLLTICVRYGIEAYPAMINSLFGMTDQATDYKPQAMIWAMIGDYLNYGVWIIVFIAYLAVGVIFFWWFCKTDKIKSVAVYQWGKRGSSICYVIGFLVLIRFCYGRGMFDVNYETYFCMYKWLVVFLLMVIALCVALLLSKQAQIEEKVWAAFLLVIIWITPLGSNNGLYPVINNLFLVAPVFMHLLVTTIKRVQWKEYTKFACNTVLYGMLLCIVVQSVLFGAFFVFHDSIRKAEFRIALPIDSPANGMRTQKEVGEGLEQLTEYLLENGLLDRKLILYGNIPALAYILDMEPAIYTTWIDLDSNSAQTLEKDLAKICKQEANEPLPVVIMRKDAMLDKTVKAQMIEAFLISNQYEITYFGSDYCVYTAPSNTESLKNTIS